MRTIKSIPDAHRAINELYDTSDRLHTSDWDRHLQRIRNNAPGVLGADYVTLDQLRAATGNIKRADIGAENDDFLGITFGIGVGAPVSVATNVTPPYVVWTERQLQIIEIFILANQPPVGSDLIIDTFLNGTSIYNATKLHFPAGTAARTVVALNNIFATPKPSFKKKDVITCNVTQVGSTTAGQDIQLVIRCQLA